MNKIDRIIEALHNNACNLDTELHEHNYADIIIPDLRHDCSDFEWSYDAGVSKFVILIRGEDLVIKIPFYHHFYEDDYYSDLSYWDNLDDEEQRDMTEPLEENYIYEFQSASNDVLEKDLGVTFGASHDYCQLECAVYEAACLAGIEQYFAKTEWYAEVGGRDIYLQQRVNPLETEKHTDWCDSETSEKCKSLGVRCFNPTWIKDFFDIYGEDEFQKLDAFLKRYHINDLHSGNLGYRDGLPIILDYSDYNEW